MQGRQRAGHNAMVGLIMVCGKDHLFFFCPPLPHARTAFLQRAGSTGARYADDISLRHLRPTVSIRTGVSLLINKQARFGLVHLISFVTWVSLKKSAMS